MILTCPSCGQRNRVPAEKLDAQPKCGACKAAMQVAQPVNVRSAEEFDELLWKSPLPILTDFWAAWCGPCKMVAPELEKLARDKAGQVVVAKVDTDALPEVAGRYQITGIPTMILFQQGREAQRVSGAMPAAAIAQQLGL
ncbi:MAG: thiol reductase thioredoxin [Sandaracinus sp.]|nr:thiol reductase thioredoxin [Sandaracinus sp.]|tara:strand:- start:764 stop:1183 length:420 start_codon:yes stop_codon:yes gene_type:complete